MKIFKKIFTCFAMFFLSLYLCGCKNKDEFDQIFDIHTELQNQYLVGDPKLIGPYATGIKELSKPNPIKLTFDIESTQYNLYISENNTFEVDVLKYTTTNKEIEIYNLKINTKYYWYVTNIDESVKSDVKTFKINTKTIRNLDIDGLTNARDLGGWEIDKNTYVKQGMIYRTSRFNENESTEVLISEKGINTMLNELKVKTEIDLRKTEDNENGGITSSPLGNTVNYVSIPMKSSGNIIILNKDLIKDVFKVLGDENNYPIVIHCSIGTDRTGLICYLINSLLGVNEENLYQDYLFSCFGEIGKARVYSTIDKYKMAINTSSGNTHKEKTYNYLIDIGVSKTDLDNILNIMIENK